jgi:hypothetical protein
VVNLSLFSIAVILTLPNSSSNGYKNLPLPKPISRIDGGLIPLRKPKIFSTLGNFEFLKL